MVHVSSVSPGAKEVVSADNDLVESVSVSIEVVGPERIPSVELVLHGAADGISLLFQVVDDSRDVSNNLV